MTPFRIGDSLYESLDQVPSAVIEAAYQDKLRPLCQCTTAGVPLYIAKRESKHFVKRMPDSGPTHDSGCAYFEPPPGLSGLGEVQGTAIQEDPESGIVKLRFDFSLSKSAGKTASPPGTSEPGETIEGEPTKLTLSATLDYLIEEAGLNRWVPAMAGKRNWYVIRAAIRDAAAAMTARAGDLSDLLFIPETFAAERKIEIQGRRLAALSRITSGEGAGRRMMLALVEVKSFQPSRYGYRLVAKHLPDFPFIVPDDLHRRMEKRFGAALGLWDAHEGTHLLCLATFSVGTNGLATIGAMTLRVADKNWLTARDGYELTLLDHLTSNGRRFIQGMRYNLSPAKPVAAVTLSDCQDLHAIFVLPPAAPESYREALAHLLEESAVPASTWEVERGFPHLPAPEGRQ